MKPRDRQKRVLGNVKQKDQKVDIVLINTPSSIVSESSISNLDNNQEDTKNYKSLLQQNNTAIGLSALNLF